MFWRNKCVCFNLLIIKCPLTILLKKHSKHFLFIPPSPITQIKVNQQLFGKSTKQIVDQKCIINNSHSWSLSDKDKKYARYCFVSKVDDFYNSFWSLHDRYCHEWPTFQSKIHYSKNSMLYIKEKCFIFLNLLLMTAGCDEAITVSLLVNRALLDHECYYQTSHTT